MKIVADQYNGASIFEKFLNLLDAFSLKILIPNRQNFIDKKDGGIRVCSNRKTKSEVHTCRVGSDRKVNKVSNLCKRNNLWDGFFHLFFVHS